MSRYLPAAAIPVGAEIRFADAWQTSAPAITVARIEHATPDVGLLAVTDSDGRHWTVNAAQRVEILSLPSTPARKETPR